MSYWVGTYGVLAVVLFQGLALGSLLWDRYRAWAWDRYCAEAKAESARKMAFFAARRREATLAKMASLPNLNAVQPEQTARETPRARAN